MNILVPFTVIIVVIFSVILVTDAVIIVVVIVIMLLVVTNTSLKVARQKQSITKLFTCYYFWTDSSTP